jgi:hypothetical protein
MHGKKDLILFQTKKGTIRCWLRASVIDEEAAEEIEERRNCFANQFGEGGIGNWWNRNWVLVDWGITLTRLKPDWNFWKKIGTNGGAYNEGTKGLRLGFWGIRCLERKGGEVMSDGLHLHLRQVQVSVIKVQATLALAAHLHLLQVQVSASDRLEFGLYHIIEQLFFFVKNL